MTSVFINNVYEDLDIKKKYLTTNYFIYDLYKKKKYNIKLIKTPFKSEFYVEKSIKLIVSKISLYRDQISEKISEYNKIDNNVYSFKWGLILDTWIYVVLSKIIYETDILEFVKKKKKKLINLKLSNKSIFFINSWDVAGVFQDSHEFNLFFLNCILKKKLVKNYKIINYKKIFLFEKIFKKFLLFFIKIFFFIKNPILLNDSYFNKKIKANIFLRSLGSIIFSSHFFKLFETNDFLKLDFKSRLNLKIKEIDKYDKNFNKILPYVIPINFYENFFNIVKNNNFFKKNISLLGSAINLHTNDFYKILCADISDNKRLKNVAFQHGGLYSLLKKNMVEVIERKYSDKFYSWDNKLGLGMHNLSIFRKIKKLEIEKKTEICLFTNYNYSYMGRFIYNFCPEYYVDSSININFYNQLNKNLQKYFLLRLFPHVSTLAKNDWINILKKKNFDMVSKSYERFNKLRIFVSDHISTAFFESIFSEVPTVIYCDYKSCGFSKNFFELLEVAKKNNIIHLDELGAAKFINKNYENILDWWNSREVIITRNRLKKFLFNENKDYYNKIIKDLHKIKNN